jgi:hypothetical protein
MQRANGGADAAAKAAAATVAPLLKLKRAAQKAHDLARYARAMELYKRAEAAAELAMPRNSLVVASLLDELANTHYDAIAQADCDNTPAPANAAAAAEAVMRSFHLLHARWQAGTLFTPTAEETAYFLEDEDPFLPAQMCGAFFYILIAQGNAVLIPPRTPAEVEARLQALYGALRTTLELDARGMLERHPRTGQAWPASSGSSVAISSVKTAVHRVVTAALCDEGPVRLRIHACGLTAAEETALRQLAERLKAVAERRQRELPKTLNDLTAMHQQAAATDAARHGLRRCALPACDAQEPHPKLFKLCGRCRGVAYCCAQHSKEDWKRHKREDGCNAAP